MSHLAFFLAFKVSSRSSAVCLSHLIFGRKKRRVGRRSLVSWLSFPSFGVEKNKGKRAACLPEWSWQNLSLKIWPESCEQVSIVSPSGLVLGPNLRPTKQQNKAKGSSRP